LAEGHVTTMQVRSDFHVLVYPQYPMGSVYVYLALADQAHASLVCNR